MTFSHQEVVLIDNQGMRHNREKFNFSVSYSEVSTGQNIHFRGGRSRQVLLYLSYYQNTLSVILDQILVTGRHQEVV